jgi:asparagine synthase (glutamine-hydrolysing)
MPLRRSADPQPIAIFGSQPLLELCLKIPTYILTAGKRPRAVVRDAFANQVPDAILRRVDKGNTGRATAIILKNNLRLVRRYLEDGILVNQGYLDPDALRAALSGPSHATPTSLLSLFSTEAWLRGWLAPNLTEHQPALARSSN